ncbi:MAG: 16S rRNA (uracil(1498)-N(3))-methyltransferase, partial [Acidobacteriota bacterium]
MNILLIEVEELEGDGRVRLAGRRAEHLRKVLRVQAGDRVRAGIVGGQRGEAVVRAVEREERGAKKTTLITLEWRPPPDSLGEDSRPENAGRSERETAVDLLVALPRPAVLHRVLQHAATFRVRRVDLVNAWKVEKSFFQSPALEPGALRRHLLLGAEQGGHTHLPEVGVHRLLMPHLEAEAERRSGAEDVRLLAHPRAPRPIERACAGAFRAGRGCVRLAIGPEGGWT